MKKLSWLVVFALGVYACGGVKTSVKMERPLTGKPSIAVVQYAVDAVNDNHHTVRMETAEIESSVSTQGQTLERVLGESGLFSKVISSGDFAANEAYLSAGKLIATAKRDGHDLANLCDEELYCPRRDKEMPLFAASKELQVPAEKVKAAAQAAGAEVVMFVLGEYYLKAGMSKDAVFDGYYALYDKDGNLIARVVAAGEQGAGMFPGGSEAVKSYEMAAERSFAEMVKALANPQAFAQ